jgi:hypothetical protein
MRRSTLNLPTTPWMPRTTLVLVRKMPHCTAPTYFLFTSATIDVKRNIYDLALAQNGFQLALVENQGQFESVNESSVRIYDIGRHRHDDDEVCFLYTIYSLILIISSLQEAVDEDEEQMDDSNNPSSSSSLSSDSSDLSSEDNDGNGDDNDDNDNNGGARGGGGGSAALRGNASILRKYQDTDFFNNRFGWQYDRLSEEPAQWLQKRGR